MILVKLKKYFRYFYLLVIKYRFYNHFFSLIFQKLKNVLTFYSIIRKELKESQVSKTICEKNYIIEEIAFGPKPSILASAEVLSDIETKLSIFLNSLANISALISPIKRIPREYINLSKLIVLDLPIEDIKFVKDKEPQPSRFSMIVLFFSNKNISIILLIIFKS